MAAAVVKLIGPDMPTSGLHVSLETVATPLKEVKARALAEWPADHTTPAPSSIEQLRLIYQGKFVTDGQLLSEAVREAPERVTMHLLIVRQPSKPADTKAEKKAEKTPSCLCVIM